MGLGAKEWARRTLYFFVFLATSISSTALTVRTLVRGGEEAEVPNLIGKTTLVAEELLRAQNLRLEVQGSRFSELRPDGAILFQTLAASDRVHKGRTVGVYLSRGPRERPAPRLAGLRFEAAKAILKSANLEGIESASACSDPKDADTVLAQDPLPGGLVSRGRILLLLSNGPCTRRFIMPEVSLMKMNQVSSEFDRSGFVVRFFRYQKNSELEPFTILSTDPKAGSIVHPYDAVTFTVSIEAKTEPTSSEGRWVYLPIPYRPTLFPKPAEVWMQRGDAMASYSIDFQVTPGENASFVLWMPPGGSLVLTVDKEEIFRKVYP